MSTEVDIKYVGDEKKNEMRDSFHICLIFLLAGCLLPCLDFCDNGVLRSDKAKIRQISPSSLFLWCEYMHLVSPPLSNFYIEYIHSVSKILIFYGISLPCSQILYKIPSKKGFWRCFMIIFPYKLATYTFRYI